VIYLSDKKHLIDRFDEYYKIILNQYKRKIINEEEFFMILKVKANYMQKEAKYLKAKYIKRDSKK